MIDDSTSVADTDSPLSQLSSTGDDSIEQADKKERSKTGRRQLLTAGAGLLGLIAFVVVIYDEPPEAEDDDDSESIILEDHWFGTGSLGLEMGVKVTNESGEEADVTVTISLFDENERLDSKPIFFRDLPDGITETDDVPLAEINRRILTEQVSHYTIEVSRDHAAYEREYKFGTDDIEFAHER